MASESSPKPALPAGFRELIKLTIKGAHRASEIWITAGEDVGRSIANRSGLATSGTRKMADIMRATAAANFSTALKLADSEHIGHAMELCADHFGKHMIALAGQIEEISKVTFQIILEGAGVHGISELGAARPPPGKDEFGEHSTTIAQPGKNGAGYESRPRRNRGAAASLPMAPTGESPDAAATPATTRSTLASWRSNPMEAESDQSVEPVATNERTLSTLESWRSAAAGTAQARKQAKVEGAPSTLSSPPKRARGRGVDLTAQNSTINPGQNAKSEVEKSTLPPEHVKDAPASAPAKKVTAKNPLSNSASVVGEKIRPQNSPRVGKGEKCASGRRNVETRNFADWIKKSPRPKTRPPR